MKHVRMMPLIVFCLAVAWMPATSQTLPGDTVEERAINGARAYVEENQLQEPSLTILLISLFRNAMPAYAAQWEELTGIKVNFIEYGYTDIPSKIMAEAIAKTGQYDIFNHFPYVVPDAAGAGVLMPVDDYIRRTGRSARPASAPCRPPGCSRTGRAGRPAGSSSSARRRRSPRCAQGRGPPRRRAPGRTGRCRRRGRSSRSAACPRQSRRGAPGTS